MSQALVAEIEGGIPLVGTVKPSGSRTLALKLIYASILSGEECVLANVPKCKFVLDDLELAEALGVVFGWSGNTLTINAGGLAEFKLADMRAGKIATSAFIVPALVHKFGKAAIPKTIRAGDYAKIWQAFGMEIKDDGANHSIEAVKLQSAEVVLPYKSRVLTEMALLTALFILGESIILNASADIETDDLIEFCTKLGAEVTRKEDGSISVKGAEVFRSATYTLPYDREEAAFFIVATLLTNGNITLMDLERSRLLPFINWLSKLGANYEFADGNMRVWHNSGTPFTATNLTVAPHPGFMTDFAPFAILLSCFADGESKITEHVLATNLDYVKELNRLGAKISTERVEDSLDITVSGSVKLKPGKMSVDNLRYALPALLYGLTVEGKNQLINYDIVESGFEDITKKLSSLGVLINLAEYLYG